MKKTITEKDLQDIFSLAKDNFVNDTNDLKDGQKFAARCYTKAVLSFLNIEDVEFEHKLVYSSVDE